MHTQFRRFVFPQVALLLAGAFLLDAKQDWLACGTHSLSSQEAIALHRAAAATRKPSSIRMRAAGAQSVARDIGNIAIIEDADGVVARRNLFNLDTRTLRFLPRAPGFQFELAAASYDAAQASAGTPLTGLDDDDARLIQLPFAFPFYGRTHNAVFVNSDGNLTFLAADTSTSDRSLGRLNAGPPRIAPLFRDLDPSRPSASVRVLSNANVLVVSWVDVPEYASSGNGPRQTFQLRLFPDGRVEAAFSSITTAEAVVGISPGSLQGTSAIVRFQQGSSETYTGTLAERFSGTESVDTVFTAQKFYETHDDAYDYLVLYNNLGIPADDGAVAYELTLRNNREGYGDVQLDAGVLYGSRRRLQGFLNMGPLSQYPRDPMGIVPARSTSRDTPLTVLGHEAGHLFLAFVSVRDANDPTGMPMLGRQTAHWNFRFNSEASLLEGNRIRDNGEGTNPRFTTTATVEGFSPLDQYLMGFRDPSEVPDTFYVAGANIGFIDRPPQPGVNFNGTRRDVNVNEIIQLYGPRRPDASMAQRRYRFGFILITAAGQEPAAEDIAKLDTFRQQFESFYRTASSERAEADTTFRRGVQLSLWPAAGIVAGTTARATVRLDRAASTETILQLRSANGLVQLPSTLTIPAGSAGFVFNWTAASPGVDEIIVTSTDPALATETARVQIAASPSALGLRIISGDKQRASGSAPLAEPVRVQVVDANLVPYAGYRVNAAVLAGGSVTPASATSDEEGYVQFTWTPGAGPVYQLNLTVEANGAVAAATALSRPFIAAGGVVNAASFTPGIVSGGIGTIFGASLAAGAQAFGTPPFTDSLAGVRVRINGLPASLLFVSDRQINFVAPAGLTPGTAQVTVTAGPLVEVSNVVEVAVLANQPGIFVQGTRAAAIRNGEFLEVYCTGLGTTQPSTANIFLEETALRPRVTIGGRDAEVLFSGLAPGFTGLYQVNVRIPAGTSGVQAVQIFQGAAASNVTQFGF